MGMCIENVNNLINNLFCLWKQQHGVKQMFTLVGGHISPILVACEKLGIRVVDTRHEVCNLKLQLVYIQIAVVTLKRC